MINHAEIIAHWNAQADEHNQWYELGEDEKVEWAFSCGANATNAALLLAKEAMEEVICGEPVFGKSVRKALAAIDAALTTTAAPQTTDIPSATASPAVILELMAERDKLREALERIAGTKATPGENGWSHWIEQARDALEAIATADDLGRAAAPVVLPEPDFRLKWHNGDARYTVNKPDIGDTDCYTADTVRTLLAGVSAPAAQAEPVAWLYTHKLGGVQAFTTEPPPGLKAQCQPLYTSPHAQADARDAERLDWLIGQDNCVVCEGVNGFWVMWINEHDQSRSEYQRGSFPSAREAIDAAIAVQAAAKQGEKQ